MHVALSRRARRRAAKAGNLANVVENSTIGSCIERGRRHTGQRCSLHGRRALVKKVRNISLTLGPARNRTQELAHKLSAEIRSGRLVPGSRLPTEQELSAATGVSRTVVREAVAALRADGLVITRQGLGAFVASDVQRWPFRIDPGELKSGADVLQILELRMSLEIEASSLAAERRSSEDLAQIKAALGAIEAEIKTGGNAVDADFKFHLAIFRASGNRYFPQFLEFLGNFIIPRQVFNVENESEKQRGQYLLRIQGEHVALFEAIRAQDATAARRAARRHLSNSLHRYQEVASRIARAAGTDA
jgi:GntR family transcriptional regulator, transcriptional repressor for pyruvate dehydrogenase complex